MRDHEISGTAYSIAMGLHQLSRDPRFPGLIPFASARLMDAVVRRVSSPFVRRLVARKRAGKIIDRIERSVLPGARLHFALRKRKIETWARREIANGKKQVVVLAAGFDSLSWRLQSEFPAVKFIEIDSPATQALKREALAEVGSLPEAIEFLPADFTRETLDTVLNRSKFWRQDVPTLYLAEGLLMYLDEKVVRKLARTLAGPPGSEHAFIFSFLERNERADVGFRAANPWLVHWLRWRHEPLLSAFNDGELRELLAATHWKLVEECPDTQWAQGVPLNVPFPAAVGETLIISHRNPD